jgi:acetyl-CoA/propionyl-CoA carboxylase biotin carboxyl carrier protein
MLNSDSTGLGKARLDKTGLDQAGFESTSFETVLVANRGEIAVRVIRTLARLGIRSVAVYSDADAGARHVREADLALRIGPAPARESYLSIDAILDAARAGGAQAIHPGYGFLSENADFARACAKAGLVLIGPPATAMEIMGDKIRAKRAVVAAGVPVVPGRFEAGMTDADLIAAAAEVGYPVLVKPSAGGGGKGMRLVRDPAALPADLVSARRESWSAFGDDTLFVERFVTKPRHIEVQVLADRHGTVVHLGERECSLQRRHQKIVEEAPSALLDPQTRDRIGRSAVEIAQAVGYVGVGTVEFIVSADRPDEFFFLEMNTRLQVEHPVTEMVTGLDLVAEQLRVAAGEHLRFGPDEVRLTGHAIEARIYAEDPVRDFLPTGGTVSVVREPTGEGVRVDSGIDVGTVVGSWYDPMLAKLVVWGPDRATALARLRQALTRTAVLGVRTNLEFLQILLADPDVVAGRLDTELVDRELSRWLSGTVDPGRGAVGPAVVGPVAVGPVAVGPTAVSPAVVGRGGDGSSGREGQVLGVYGLVRLLQLQPERVVGVPVDPWSIPSGWRVGESRPLLLRTQVGTGTEVGVGTGGTSEIRVWGGPEAARVRVGDGPVRAASIRTGVGGELLVTMDGVTRTWLHAVEADRVWLWCEGRTWVMAPAVTRLRNRAEVGGAAEIRSPMPGVVLAVQVDVGDPVEAGQPLIVVEAMKMEHTVRASRNGWVGELLVQVGDQVALDQSLALIHSSEGASE